MGLPKPVIGLANSGATRPMVDDDPKPPAASIWIQATQSAFRKI